MSEQFHRKCSLDKINSSQTAIFKNDLNTFKIRKLKKR